MNGNNEKKHGCFFWGCLTVLVLIVLIVGIVSFSFYSLYKKTLSFTSEKPAAIAVYQASEQEITNAKAKADALAEAVSKNKNEEISFTESDINTLIASHPRAKDFAGKLAIQIKGDEITADGSIPLNKLPGFRNRYLNGTFSIKVSMNNGLLQITPTNIEVSGKSLPDEFIQALRQANLADDLYKDQNFRELIQKVKSINVENGKLVIKTGK